jgi:Ca2+/H+ antiporter
MAKNSGFIFSRKNYSLILVSIVLLIMGFSLMTGQENRGTAGFNRDIYSFRRITLSPVVLLAGYTLMIFSIMAEKKKSK